MDDRFNRLEDKVDNLSADMKSGLSAVDKQLAIYNLQLEQHIEGVKLAREQNALLKSYVETKLTPLEQHVEDAHIRARVFKKLTYYMVTLLGALASLAAIYQYLYR